MKAILMVEDEESIRKFVVAYLNKAGYIVDQADNGQTGYEMALTGNHSLILLDLMLPKMDGLTICSKIREAGIRTPVIMLTAKSQEEDLITGFTAGADDYITKPFSPRELVVRVNALMARTYPTQRSITMGPILFNLDSTKVAVDNEEINLTPKEFDLLLFLCKNPMKTFSRDELLKEVWEYEYSGPARTVDTHVKQVREKLGIYREVLETVWSKGYRLNPDAPAVMDL
jgi:two-component system response regulator ResD